MVVIINRNKTSRPPEHSLSNVLESFIKLFLLWVAWLEVTSVIFLCWILLCWDLPGPGLNVEASTLKCPYLIVCGFYSHLLTCQWFTYLIRTCLVLYSCCYLTANHVFLRSLCAISAYVFHVYRARQWGLSNYKPSQSQGSTRLSSNSKEWKNHQAVVQG